MRKIFLFILLGIILCSCSATNNPSISENYSESESIHETSETSESLTESNTESETESFQESASTNESESEEIKESESEQEEKPTFIPKYQSHPTSEPNINKILSTINPLGEISKVWEHYRGNGVTVAVIDSGFDIDHPEFFDEHGKSIISDKSVYISSTDDGNITKSVGKNNVKITDGDSHGTMCAGILGSAVNGYGITGIAPNCELMLIKIDKKAYSMAEAFRYAADNGAKVISTSLGTYPNSNGQSYGDIHFKAGVDVSTIFNKNIKYAYDKGVTIIAATGNDRSTTLTYPAGCDYVIGAGGLNGGSMTEIWDEGGEGSNYNGSKTYVDVFAPSSHIYAPGYDTSKNTHTYWSEGKGTSFSAPIIAGAAALYFEKYPTKTNIDFENALKNTSANISSYNNNKNMGYGRLCVNNLLNINDDYEIISYDKEDKIKQTATSLTIVDEAGWNLRTLHIWDISFKNGYGLSDFENYMNDFYGNRISTSSYQLEGTTKGWAYSDEGYIGDYFICVGNQDHAKATTYTYIFPHWVKGLKYQIVNNNNWIPEGGLNITENNGYGKSINTYFWYKSSYDTGTSPVIGNNYQHEFSASVLTKIGQSTTTENVSIYDYLESINGYYFDSNKKYPVTRIKMNKNLTIYQ